jgi:hypothetical protein
MYLGPIMAAPLAHIAVTLYRDAKTSRQKQLILGVGIIGSTVMTLGMRMYLMYHSGYPGGNSLGGNPEIAKTRIRQVTEEERRAITNPDAKEILRQAFRGFG